MGIISRVAAKAATETAEKSAAKVVVEAVTETAQKSTLKSEKAATRKIDADAAKFNQPESKAFQKDAKKYISSYNNEIIGSSSNIAKKSITTITDQNDDLYKKSVPKFIPWLYSGVFLVLVMAAFMILKAYLKPKSKAL